MTRTINVADYKTVTFDCYGTLIDWESGLLGYLQPLFKGYYINTIDEFVLACFSEFEPAAQAQGGSYREVLARVMEGFARRLAFTPTDDVVSGLAQSVEQWPAFEDTLPALQALKAHFELCVISNTDDDLFESSSKQLGVEFDHVVTAQKVGAYKPDPAMFETALDVVKAPVLHVAQSRFHDIVPASTMGLDTVWINRPSRGAARPVEANPTWTFDSLADFTAALATD
jgi:2-haloacid dehalogenase